MPISKLLLSLHPIMKKDYSKGVSIAIVTTVYLMAGCIGLFCFSRLHTTIPEPWALLAADVAATVFVWLYGLIYENVSVYDPYWSVLPPVVFTAWAFYKHCFTLPVILLLIAVWYWGTRLTLNWAATFKGLAHEDWRYTRYREMLPAPAFQAVNFFGLNLFPTLIVFAAMLPGLGLFEGPAEAGPLTWAGFAMCLAAPTIQLVADSQIHRFREAHPGECCDAGLWKHGRHPNYFGEVLMWWGVWVMWLGTNGFSTQPWFILAPIAMTAMFLFISIPMMERRQLQNKPAYAEYRRRTRIFI